MRCLARLGLIEKNEVGFQLLSQRNCFPLTRVEIKGRINESRRTNVKPVRWSSQPMPIHLGRLRAREFLYDRGRSKNAPKV